MNWKSIFTSALALSLCVQAPCQERVQDVNSYLSNEVYKNIAAYNIRYCSNSFNGVTFTRHFHSNSQFFYNSFIPDYGFKMDMKINRLNLSYPNERFHLYEISTNGFRFTPDTGNVGLTCTDSTSTDTYLLALNEGNGDIKFISGQYFKSAISQDFKPDLKEPNTLIPYLTMRAYVIKASNIVYVKKKHRHLIYSAYSLVLQKKAILSVSTKDIEEVAISVK